MTVKCTLCGKEVADENALQQHNEAKHPEKVSKPFFTEKRKKQLIWTAIAILIAAGILYAFSSLNQTKEQEQIVNITAASLSKIPTTATHWHPHLTIIIDNQTYPIPAGVGITLGKVIDTGYGMDTGMAPTHTHDADGVIHLENLNPRAKPETFALGYFFYVWDKEFSKNCIFNYCTDKGTLTMTVNGKENQEFENYIMQDKDEILISYTSFENVTQNPS